MRKLYFVRHGQSTLNVQGVFSGHSNPPLTSLGRTQAKQAGQSATSLGIDLIVSSPLSRALTTAQIIAAEIDYPLDKILIKESLTERNFGRLENQPYQPSAQIKHIDYDAEADDLLIKRARLVYEWLQNQPVDTILVVGHGGIGRALRHVVNPEADFYQSLANAEIVQWL